MKKRLIALVIAICVVAAVVVPAGAANSESAKELIQGVDGSSGNYSVRVIEKGLDYNISECVDENHTIIRTFTRDDSALSNNLTGFSPTTDDIETKSLLNSIGMEPEYIDNLSQETLANIAKSNIIMGAVSYVKIDAEGNSSYVDEETALRESRQIDEAQKASLRANGTVQNTYQDAYMRVYIQVTHQGSGHFLLISDARWLTMPIQRFTDTIGSCAQHMSVMGYASGWYEYDLTYVKNNTLVTETPRTTMSSSHFKNAVNGDWYGSAAYFTLPANPSSSMTLNNFKVHYQYYGAMYYPALEQNFNAIASYTHKTIQVNNPNISISLGGSVSASIGASVGVGGTRRSVEIFYHYVP